MKRTIEECIAIDEGDGKKDSDSSKLVYNHLEGLPCLMLLVEKGRMGDTFPQSFNCLDLRPRDAGTANTATIVQELGRMCRYCNMDESSCRKVEVNCLLREDAVDVEIEDHKYYGAFTEGGEFLGFCSHVKPWGRLADPEAIFSFTLDGAISLATEEVDLELPCHPPNYLGDFEGCRVAFFHPAGKDQKKGSKDARYLMIKEHKKESRQIKLLSDLDLQLEPKKGWTCAVFRDQACLETHAKTIENQDRHDKRLALKEIYYVLPHALVTGPIFRDIEKGIDKADATCREISECIKFSTLDRFVTTPDSDDGGRHQKHRPRNYAEMITRTKNPLHDYRQSYLANRGTRKPGTKRPNDKAEDDKFQGQSADFGRIVNSPRHRRRFLVFAECQIGKTGAYCEFLNLLYDEIGQQIPPEVPEGGLPQSPNKLEWSLPFWKDICFSGKACTPGWKRAEDPRLEISRGKYHDKVRCSVPNRPRFNLHAWN